MLTSAQCVCGSAHPGIFLVAAGRVTGERAPGSDHAKGESMSNDPKISMEQLLVLEYEHIKDEQKARIGFRDNLLYATLASMAAVVALSLNPETRAALLLLPPVSLLLGWTYLMNDEKISAIGRYIREQVGPRLAELRSDREPVFGWESAHRSDRRRTVRKQIQLGVDLIAFCGAPLAALIVYWAGTPGGTALITISVLEALGIAVLAWQIVVYADLGRSRPPLRES
ncbi:hypothetical protein [Streptomyces sp. bgisy027]|uniref:hypothetical protein n=1 Tax=Streptomyces sp. bgisy027 TaxID=3413770 RepID=UPI003D759353